VDPPRTTAKKQPSVADDRRILFQLCLVAALPGTNKASRRGPNPAPRRCNDSVVRPFVRDCVAARAGKKGYLNRLELGQRALMQRQTPGARASSAGTRRQPQRPVVAARPVIWGRLFLTFSIGARRKAGGGRAIHRACRGPTGRHASSIRIRRKAPLFRGHSGRRAAARTLLPTDQLHRATLSRRRARRLAWWWRLSRTDVGDGL